MGTTIASLGSAPTLPPPSPTVSGGGGVDLSTALADLSAAVAKLQAAVDALAGATAVQGGGGTSASHGCSCDHGSAQAALAPPGTGANGTVTTPPVEASRPDPSSPPQPSSPAPPAASGGVRERIVAAARAELARGVTEDAGPDKDKAGRIREYRTAVTGPGEDPDQAEAWCADFASWVRKQAGAAFGPGGTGEDYTVAMISKAKAEGTWHQRGSYDPKPGDLVMIDWQGGTDVDHVAVVEKVENGKVYTIAGNESDRVNSASYSVTDSKLMGFISPPGA